MFSVEVEFWFSEILLFGLWSYIPFLPYFVLWIIIYIDIRGCGDGKHWKESLCDPHIMEVLWYVYIVSIRRDRQYNLGKNSKIGIPFVCT